jgi:REP element-mobilizing transposase RayT
MTTPPIDRPSPPRVRRFVRARDDRRDCAYLVTLYAAAGATPLARLADGTIELLPAGLLAAEAWLEIPLVHPHVSLDAWVVLPDHLHGILWIEDPRGAPLAAVVKQFKDESSRRIRELPGARSSPVWGAGHCDRVLRSFAQVASAREWVGDGPRRWAARTGRR